MVPNKIIKPVAFVLIVLYFASCSTTYEVTRRSEFVVPDDLGELTVKTKDNKIYQMDNYRLNDSVLTFTGIFVSSATERPVSGKLNLSEIKEIQATEGSLGKTVLVAGAGAAILITFIVFLSKQNGLSNDIVLKYPTGGGCPKVTSETYRDNIPIAAGLKGILDENISNENDVFYLEVTDLKGIYYFKVRDYADMFRIELLNDSLESIDSSKKISIDLCFLMNQEHSK